MYWRDVVFTIAQILFTNPIIAISIFEYSLRPIEFIEGWQLGH